ncbi:transposase [Spiroplasma endosymbiont of Cleonymus obscurus]
MDVPRDRNSNFTPVIVPKRQRRFDGFDQQVLSLYAKGMTLSDISVTHPLVILQKSKEWFILQILLNL